MSESLNPLILLGISFVILVIFSAFFSACETSYTSISYFKYESHYKKRKKNWVFVVGKKLLNQYQMTLSTILILNTLVNTAASTLSALFFSNLLIYLNVANSESIATGIATGVITFLILIFGEFIPKALARKCAIKFIKFSSPVIYVFYLLLFPINWLLNKIVKPINSKSATEQEIDTLIDIVSNEGVLENSEASLVSNSLKFDETKIQSVFTKNKDIISVNYKDSKDKILKHFIDSTFTRLPVKKNNNIIGVIDLKSFIKYLKKDSEKFKIDNIIKPILKVSQYQSLDCVFREMQINQMHMAIVKKNNDSRQVLGIVTMEDIIEFLVGEIHDEHDETLPVTEINDFTWKVSDDYNASKFISEYLKLPYVIDENLNIKEWIKNEFNIDKFKNKEKYDNDDFYLIIRIKKQEISFIFEKKVNTF